MHNRAPLWLRSQRQLQDEARSQREMQDEAN